MVRLIQFMLTLVITSVQSRLSLQAENAALRNQLSLYRKSRQRPRIEPAGFVKLREIQANWLDEKQEVARIKQDELSPMQTQFVLTLVSWQYRLESSIIDAVVEKPERTWYSNSHQ